MKTFCRKCLAKDIKLNSFLGGNPRKKINFEKLINVDYFYEFEILVLNFARNFVMCFDSLLYFFSRTKKVNWKEMLLESPLSQTKICKKMATRGSISISHNLL